jgi:uncharacterized membrane protein YgdD (TMEM256/DUF423 family)
MVEQLVRWERWPLLVLATAGLVGAAGVAAAAGASHGGSRNLASIASIGLSHGPALLALGLAGRGRAMAIAAALLGAGTIVFLTDLALREWGSGPLITAAAPLGGGLMVAGWLAVVAAATIGLRNQPPQSG